MKMFLDLLFWAAVGFLVAIPYASFFEWALHRYVMHKPLGSFDYAFKAHAVVHHQIFKADLTYHLQDEKDKHTIPMAWWNGPVLIAINQIPFLIWSFFSGHWGIVIGSALCISAYYGAYEYMHWCMHLPKNRNIERSWIYYRLNGHHLLHHRYMHKNFNVVLPLADLLLRTLKLRSDVTFGQPRGPAVPDVSKNWFPFSWGV